MDYTYKEYEDAELDYIDLMPLFGLSDTTWHEPKHDEFMFNVQFDCDCGDSDCHFCT